MFDGVHKDIIRAIKLFNDGMEEKALEVFNKIQEKGDLTSSDKHYFQFFKAYTIFFLGRVQDALDMANQLYEDSSNSENPLFLIDAILLKSAIMYLQGRVTRSQVDVAYCKKILKSAPQEPLSEYEMRRSIYYFLKGFSFSIERVNMIMR